MTAIFLAVPSYRGISEEEVRERCAEKALSAAGHSTAVAVLRGLALIDLARAELTAIFMSKTKCEMVLYQDDDISIEATSLLKMIDLMSSDASVGVISAPCKMRSEGNLYNVVPTSAPDEKRLSECLWTGLGSVLVSRKVIASLYVKYPRLRFQSQVAPGAQACGLFNSIVVDAEEYGGEPGTGTFMGDDRAFSHRLRQSDVQIYAYVDAVTDHRGIRGCLGEDLRQADVEARQRGEVPVEPVGLVDATGRPL